MDGTELTKASHWDDLIGAVVLKLAGPVAEELDYDKLAAKLDKDVLKDALDYKELGQELDYDELSDRIDDDMLNDSIDWEKWAREMARRWRLSEVVETLVDNGYLDDTMAELDYGRLANQVNLHSLALSVLPLWKDGMKADFANLWHHHMFEYQRRMRETVWWRQVWRFLTGWWK